MSAFLPNTKDLNTKQLKAAKRYGYGTLLLHNFYSNDSSISQNNFILNDTYYLNSDRNLPGFERLVKSDTLLAFLKASYSPNGEINKLLKSYDFSLIIKGSQTVKTKDGGTTTLPEVYCNNEPIAFVRPETKTDVGIVGVSEKHQHNFDLFCEVTDVLLTLLINGDIFLNNVTGRTGDF